METKKEIRWSAPEFHHYEKDVSWYWILGIVTIAIVIIVLIQKNFLFAIFSIIAASLVISWGKKQPDMLDFSLSETGLNIEGKKNYGFNELAGFTIIPHYENPEISELILKKKTGTGDWIKVIIATQRSEAIHTLASEFLEEIDYKESLTDHIAKRIRF